MSGSRRVAKIVITPEALGDIIGVDNEYKIIGAEWDAARGTIHLTFTGPEFRDITDGNEVPVITGLISTDGSGTRKFSWGEYLS